MTAVLVIGTPRSGTSCVAGILHCLGVPMGQRIDDPDDPDRWNFSDPNDFNPKGFFQDAGFSNLEDREFGYDPPSKWKPSESFITELAGLISERSSHGPLWGVKSNRIQFYLSEFRRLYGGEVKIITTMRAIERAKASWAAREKHDGGVGIKFIDKAHRKLNEIRDSALVIEYDDLFDATAETVQRIAGFVGRAVTTDALEFVEPSLRRF